MKKLILTTSLYLFSLNAFGEARQSNCPVQGNENLEGTWKCELKSPSPFQINYPTRYLEFTFKFHRVGANVQSYEILRNDVANPVRGPLEDVYSAGYSNSAFWTDWPDSRLKLQSLVKCVKSNRKDVIQTGLQILYRELASNGNLRNWNFNESFSGSGDFMWYLTPQEESLCRRVH